MKKLLTICCLFLLNALQAQYFQQRYNLNYAVPKLRDERFNSGLISRVNYINFSQNFYNVGIGTSYNNPALPVPDNTCDRLRFTSIGTLGLTLFSNVAHQFASIGNRWYNASGNSIAEVDNKQGTGGYVAVGAVTNNPLTEATGIAGTSDILFTRLDDLGNVISARRIDLDQSTDIAWCIRKSVVVVNGQPTWIMCGQSQRGNAFTDCFVARVLVDGTILWARRYNFDPGGGQFNSATCIAKQLCEGPTGLIYVVGTMQDNPAGANGIDGLAFALTQNGGVIWGSTYNAFTDDEFQAVRFSATGTLAIGGFTNFAAVAPVTSHMLFAQLNIANGAVISQNILRAVNGGNTYSSRCYDLVQVPGNQYYLAGPVVINNGIYEMMYRTTQAGLGVNWYRYNRMNYNVGFGIDNQDLIPGQGLAYFSSERDSLNPTFSDSHMMRTDYNGRTCSICPGIIPANTPIFLSQFFRNNRNNPTGTALPLVWASFNYSNSNTCNDATITCNGVVAAAPNSENVSSKVLNNNRDIKLYPNPARSIVTLEFNNQLAGEYNFTLLNTEGRIVLQKNKVYNNGFSISTIDVASLPAGIYLLQIKNGENIITKKVVKQ
jgi:hypothetical protein